MRVAVVVAHADDEVLGCGGTIAKHAMAGDTIRIVYMTPNITSRKDDDARLDMARKSALTILGCGHNIWYHIFDFADQMLDRMGQLKLARAVESQLGPFAPDVVYTHSDSDLNADHRCTWDAVMVAVGRPVRGRILSFEVLSSTEWGSGFTPQIWGNVNNTIKAKCRAMIAYGSELREWPHPRSLRGIITLARYRGMQGGVEYAEAFELQQEAVCH